MLTFSVAITAGVSVSQMLFGVLVETGRGWISISFGIGPVGVKLDLERP